MRTATAPHPCVLINQRALTIIGSGFAVAFVFSLCVSRTHEPSDRTTPVLLRVDPNRAHPSVLEALPKIGPALARRIVETREQAPFLDVADFDRRVRGIGPATIKAVRPYLRLRD